MLNLPQQKLIRWLDSEVKKQMYGTFSLTVVVKNGEPVNKTARMVKMRRRKYKIPTA